MSGAGTISYWPFCIAASADADYAPIAAPDFLVRSGDLDFFRSRHFRLTEPTEAPETFRLGFASVPGEFACTYRSAASVVGGKPGCDHAGRPLYHAIGFIAGDPGIDARTAAAILEDCEAPMRARLGELLAGRDCAPPLATERRTYAPAPGSLR